MNYLIFILSIVPSFAVASSNAASQEKTRLDFEAQKLKYPVADVIVARLNKDSSCQPLLALMIDQIDMTKVANQEFSYRDIRDFFTPRAVNLFAEHCKTNPKAPSLDEALKRKLRKMILLAALQDYPDHLLDALEHESNKQKSEQPIPINAKM